MSHPPYRLTKTTGSTDRQVFGGGFTMAFQPIYDVTTGTTFAHEALVRSPAGGGAADVMRHVTRQTRYSFDRRCRIKAIAMATALGLRTRLAINCLPDAVMDPDACIRSTLIAADHYGFDIRNLIFEIAETAYLRDPEHLRAIMASYRRRGFMTAIDNFGAGFSGLGALCDMQTDLIKLDMRLVRGIDGCQRRQHLVRSVVGLCRELGTGIVVEGVETRAEFDILRDSGITHFQGFYLGGPLLEGLRKAPLIPLPVAA